jgi:hypothetical protein
MEAAEQAQKSLQTATSMCMLYLSRKHPVRQSWDASLTSWSDMNVCYALRDDSFGLSDWQIYSLQMDSPAAAAANIVTCSKGSLPVIRSAFHDVVLAAISRPSAPPGAPLL